MRACCNGNVSACSLTLGSAPACSPNGSTPPARPASTFARRPHAHPRRPGAGLLHLAAAPGIIFHCHVDHAVHFASCSRAFRGLEEEGLVQQFGDGEAFRLGDALRCRALPIRHDGGPTFAFRFEGPADIFGNMDTLVYATDLGTWDHDLVHEFANVDVLALEFNHDVQLQRSSGRSPFLIARVLGDDGHLSNAQAAGLLSEVLARSERGRLRHLVQLHLSRDCNRPDLATTAARTVLAEWDERTTIHTARQDRPLPTLAVGWEFRRRQDDAGRTDRDSPSRRPDDAAGMGCRLLKVHSLSLLLPWPSIVSSGSGSGTFSSLHERANSVSVPSAPSRTPPARALFISFGSFQIRRFPVLRVGS